MIATAPSILQELAFLKEHTGEDEAILLSRAVDLGLQILYREAVEQAFIDETIPRQEAIAVLGLDRVAELEYAKQALETDIRRGLNL
jgi:hypothetical protein